MNLLKKLTVPLCGFLFANPLLFGTPGYERGEWTRPLMGTVFHIIVYSPAGSKAEESAFKAFELIERLENTLSYYQEESELNRLARVGFEETVTVSPDLYQVLEASLHWSRETGGAFDFTLRPLINLWRRRGEEGLMVSPAEIEEARKRIGYDKVLVNRRLRSVRLLAPGMMLDLGGIAKGFAADRAFESLRNDGFRIILIDAGGDIRVGDPPPSLGGWRINLEDAVKGSSRLLLQGCAVATSGDKYKFFDIQGTRYSHIVNPVTGRGMTDHRQVTIIAGDGITADALATALSVMDIRAGLALAESLPGVQALIRVLNPEQAASGKLAGDTASAETFIVYRTSGFPGLD